MTGYLRGRRAEARRTGIPGTLTGTDVDNTGMELESYFAAIIESSDDAIISKTLDGVITSWNPAATRLFGYSPEEAIGRSILMLIPPERHPEEDMILSRLRAGQKIDHYETCRRTRSGEIVEVSLTISPIKDSAGRCIGASKIAREVGARKRAEQAAFQLAAIVESSEDAIISKTLDGIITSWNAAAARIFGYTPQEAIGRSILMIIPPELQPEEFQILGRVRSGQRVDHFETRRMRRDGTLIDVSLTISPIRDQSGRIIGASKIARDITQHRQSEEALRRTEKLAVAGRLAATIAHEINNPLAAITNLVYLIKTDPTLGAESRRRIATVEEELERVCGIARQTLGFYRDTTSPAEFNLSETIDEVLSVFGRRMLARQLTVHTEIRNCGRIVGFKGELRQIISNLIANAMDATPMGGRIVIRLENSCRRNGHPQAGVRLTIADTGQGIPADSKPKLFQPFFTTKSDTGTGLGLWHAASLVKKHGGIIQFRSSTDPGKSGTVFSIFIPTRTAAAVRQIA